MTAATRHRLQGLEPDNLLAFLALLGLLRTLETAGLRPRAHWEGLPMRPVLSLPEAMTEEAVAQAAAKGCAKLAVDYDFEGKESQDYTGPEFREVLLRHGHDPALWARRQQVLSPLGHEAVLKGGKLGDPTRKVERSPFNCLDVAQVKFLKSLVLATRVNRKQPERIKSALFALWERNDRFVTFRWDPSEIRRHAYRAIAPTNDPVRTQAGAVSLAAFGLPVMLGAAVAQGVRLRFMVLGSRRSASEDIEITWPVWSVPASLTALQTLLAHPALTMDVVDFAALRGHSIFGAFRTRKITLDRYGNFTRAEAV